MHIVTRMTIMLYIVHRVMHIINMLTIMHIMKTSINIVPTMMMMSERAQTLGPRNHCESLCRNNSAAWIKLTIVTTALHISEATNNVNSLNPSKMTSMEPSTTTKGG